MQDAFSYLYTSTYSVSGSTEIIFGEDYVIDGSTYTAEGSTPTITGEDYVVSGETYTYTIYGTTVSTSVIIGEYDEAKGGWLTNIAGVIVMVIGGVVYFLHKKKNE